jgi:hypothetical protein
VLDKLMERVHVSSLRTLDQRLFVGHANSLFAH